MPRWRPPAGERIVPKGAHRKARANLDALAVVRQIEDEARPATAEEQVVLARWSGWGAVPQIFDESDDRSSSLRAELRGLVDDEAWDAARRTVLNAHYTDPAAVAAMWEAVARLGFDGGRVLEPGCGSGNFIGHAPPEARMVGVERDPTTAAVARALYPDAEIHTGPFERLAQAESFDAAIGNVPFAKVTPTDTRFNRGRHSLHNYFLIKSLALTRPGGLVVALTSRYTLDARNPAARRELAQLGDLVGAVRLPTDAMAAVADTSVILDLVILRRRAPGAEPIGETGWDRVVEVGVVDEATGDPATTMVNRYFAEHPDHVLGDMVVGQGMYRDGELLVRGDPVSVGDQLRAVLATVIDASPLRYQPAPDPPVGQPSRRVVHIGDVELASERAVPLRHDNFVVTRTGVIYRVDEGRLVNAEVPKRSTDEVRALIVLRDRTVNLLRLEADDAPEADIEDARRRLGEACERYRHRWGPLNRVSWARTGRYDPATGEERRRRVAARLGGFRRDPDWPTLSAIEVYDDDLGIASAAPILLQRTIHPPVRPLGADTAEEALAVSLDETGRVDLDRIADLLGVTVDEARIDLTELVYQDPATGDLVTSEDYLSGDVRTKLGAARAAVAHDPGLVRNVAALEAVQPAQLRPGEIVVRPGAPWVDTADVADFVREVFGATDPKVTYTGSLGAWALEVPPATRRSVTMSSEWGTRRASADRLFEGCLNQRLAKVYDEDADGRRILNVDETTAAREKQERLAERFSAWIWEYPVRAERVAERYNALFNSYVAPGYTGEHLTFPGLASTFVPHGHQRAAVARILREGRSLLAHAVGAGKTATMVMAGMELRRLGLTNRPAFVVPNHMLEQFSRELLQLYPQARVLIATKDLTGRDGRQNFVARCATGDWDAVVITHSAFERLPMREASYRAYTDDRLGQVRAQLTEAMASKGSTRGLVKRLEAAVARAEARLERLLATAAKDDGVCWEETGIDYLFVDELHLFKNKPVTSSIEGIRADGSQRAIDLDAKLWTLRRDRGHRVLTGATATPIANSITEAWVMQTYTQSDVLADTGLDTFDAWAATFGQTVAAVELAPDGGSYRVTSRLAKYRNVPELIALFRRTADVRVRADLDLTLPALKDGRPTVEVVPASEQLEDYVRTLVDRAEAIRNRQVEPDEDNMLKVTGDGRHAALDLRLVGEDPDLSGGKLEAAARRIVRIHRDTRHLAYLDDAGQPSPRPGGFQIVFCDLSTPRADGGWSAYEELRRRLVAHGVPAGEVAFIHDARNDEARARLFARCRNGQIAVLIGSTGKMGVGTNIHTRAVALHHIDCPWRPADIEQREGRVIRQGNQNPIVEIVRYATEGSFDVYMWQTCERKAGFIDQVMRGQVTGRDLDDVGENVLSYAEVKALATGNPLVIEQAGVQAELAKLERLARAHVNEQHRLERTAASASAVAARLRAAVARYDAAIARRVDTSGDRFSMEIEGRRHTKRVEAGEDLVVRLRRATTQPAEATGDRELHARVVGRLGGFPLKLEVFTLSGTVAMSLTLMLDDDGGPELRFGIDDLDDKRPDTVITQLEGRLRRLEDMRDRAVDTTTDHERHATEARARLGTRFPDQARLDHLLRRHREIADTLAADALSDPTGWAPPQIERTVRSVQEPDRLPRLERQRAERTGLGGGLI